MKAANEVWTDALETWQGMIPPWMNPRVVEPAEALRIGLGVQGTLLRTWRDSCQQAHELGMEALDWNLQQAERAAQLVRESGR